MPFRDPLLAATLFRSSKAVKELLNSGTVSPDGPLKEFITPLHIAVVNNDIKCVKLLIQHGANTNLQTNYRHTPLHLATICGTSLKIVKELLRAGSDVNINDFSQKTPLHAACLESSFDKVREILAYGTVDLGSVDDEGATAMHHLMLASSNEMIPDVVDILKLAIRKGFDINAQTKTGETILHVASQIFYSDESVPEILKLEGINATVNNGSGNNFVHCFLKYRRAIEMSESLLCQLLDRASSLIPEDQLALVLNHQNNDGQLPVTLYIMHGIIEVGIAKGMINLLSDVNVKDKLGHTLSHIVVQSALLQEQKISLINYLIRNGADLNAKDIFGRTPLFFAQNLRIVRLLVESGANVNAVDQCKRTPLMTTLIASNPRICEYLVEKGSGVNSRDKYGHTALHYAAWENRIREVKLLVKLGADVNIRDKSGRTPNDVAYYWACRDTVDILYPLTRRPDGSPLALEKEPKNSCSEKIWVHLDKSILYSKCRRVSDLRRHLHLPEDVEEYFKKVLHLPGVGFPHVVEEASWIESIVLLTVKNVARRIGELDGRFKCSIFRSGSTYEGTKIDDPDEYDFLFILDKFSSQCTVESNVASAFHKQGFENPVAKTDKVPTAVERYFDHDKSLICGRLRDDFFSLINQALTDKNTWQTNEIYIDGFSIRDLQRKPVVNFRLFVVGAFYKGIYVSVDIVPALKIKDWRPVNARLTSDQVVPKSVLQENFLLLCQQPEQSFESFDDAAMDTDSCFRISCAPFEIKLMGSFPKWVSRSYALAKMMKGNYMCPRLKFQKDEVKVVADIYRSARLSAYVSVYGSSIISSYMLKNSLFHVVASEPKVLKRLPFPDKSELYNSIALALRIYECLGNAAVRRMLPVYFLPYLNIFDEKFDIIDTESGDDDDISSSCDVIKFFCDFIIKLNRLQ